MVVSVGIDVGKISCSVALRYENGSYTESSFPNTPEGVQKFISFLSTKEVSFETPLVLESTGRYHLLFAMTLKDTHFRGVKVINAILTKKYQKAKIRKTKTDVVDAKVLADIGFFEDLSPFTQTKKQLLQKKRTTLLKQLQKIRQQLKASLKNAQETAETIQFDLQTKSLEIILKSIEKEMKRIEQEIVKDEMNPFVEELAEIPGISIEIAATLLALLGGKSFSSKAKLVAFTGLDLSVRESGLSIHGMRHLSKRGDPFLRKKLFQAAWALKMRNPQYQAYYQKKREEGHHYYTCLIAVARKFLYHFYALQKNHLHKSL